MVKIILRQIQTKIFFNYLELFSIEENDVLNFLLHLTCIGENFPSA